jgi:glutamyl-tRNA synthetase
MAVRVRFAPSPTGYLHIGGLRTALFNHLFARATGGTFVLRIEDTDQTRFVPGSASNLVKMLRWAGITIDEGPGVDPTTATTTTNTTNYGSYVQSERLPLYQKHAQQLVESGNAYPCFCSPGRLAMLRKSQQKSGSGAMMYDRRCHKLPPEEVQRRLENEESHTIRMLVPNKSQGGETIVSDMILGPTKYANAVIDDQILMKSDGYPTYHLANVVDDHHMDISHVIRGEEWLPSTPKHQLLYEAFQWKVPQFAHLPLLLNAE